MVRHGQAGTREHYDSLSELGREQARRLGEYFSSTDVEFDAVYSGCLERQRATAETALPGVRVIADAGWNEFDLAQVYAGYAPHLAADDDNFRREYEAMQEQMAASRGLHAAPVHRRWNDCDKKIIYAWIESRYEYSGESWPVFVARIHRAFDRVVSAGHDGNVAVFTSATPIGVSAGRTLELEDARAMRIASVLLNASFTTLRVRVDEVRLFGLNNAPHLGEARLRTFR